MRVCTLSCGIVGVTLFPVLALAQPVPGQPTQAAPADGAPAAKQSPPPAEAAAQAAADKPAQPAEEERTANNAVFAELGGSGVLYSVNYERLFGDSGFSVRGGVSYMSIGASGGSGSSASVSFMTFPVLGNYYVGGLNHKLQLGLGATFMYASVTAGSKTSLASVEGFVPAPTVVVGYRYIPAKGGFTFFIGATPFIIPGGDSPVFPWGGLSFGGVF